MTPGSVMAGGCGVGEGGGGARRVCAPWSRREPANSLITSHHQN